MTRYYTRIPRYIDGVYYAADAEHPALVDIPDKYRVNPNDKSLTKVDTEEAPPKADPVQPPFARPNRKAKERIDPSKEPPHGRQPKDPARPSDLDPATDDLTNT